MTSGNGFIHATPNYGSDYTLCGFADDGENGDYKNKPEYAEPGEIVTCPECRRLIKYCKTFKRYRQP